MAVFPCFLTQFPPVQVLSLIPCPPCLFRFLLAPSGASWHWMLCSLHLGVSGTHAALVVQQMLSEVDSLLDLVYPLCFSSLVLPAAKHSK
jgi:hypothetical protein